MKKFKYLFLALVVVLMASVIACNPTGASTKMLTFEMNGHGTQVQAQKLTKEQSPEIPEDPTEDGWIFDGWYIDEDFSDYYYFEPIYQDTTVYARWVQAVTVSFDTGVDGVTIPSKDVKIGGKVDLPTNPTAPGKKFEGWYVDSAFTSEFNVNTPITANVTLYAKWSTYFKVTFDKNGRGQSSKTPAPQEYYAIGSKAVKPDDMSGNGYKFAGWSISSDGSSGIYDFDAVLTDSITLYAVWIRLYNVTFDLNNEYALQPNPDRQAVEEGGYAIEPTEPIVSGYKFIGWYTQKEGGEKVDFTSFAITSTTTLYAHWEKTGAGKIEVDVPDVDYNKEAPYGERPDLDGFIIDGKMSKSEEWENRNWYSTATVDAPTVSYSVTTRFSDKGLYLFFIVKDNGGLYNAGNNLSYRNSHLEFAIADGKEESYHSRLVKTFLVDTYSLFPSYNRAKIATYIAEGEVNTPSMDNKSATMHVEAFITWKDLGIEVKPSTVKIETVYNYKRISSDVIKYSLQTTFTDGSSFSEMKEYVEYDDNGYTKKDAQNAIVGDSPYGTAKTADWDITHESDEKDAYVSSNGSKLQAIFFKEKADTGYFEVDTTIDAGEYVESGKAGIMVYADTLNYASLMFAVNSETYDRAQNKFIIARPQLRVTDNNGKEQVINLDEVDVSKSGKIDAKVIFHNGYFYCIVNGRFIYCKFIEALNNRLSPALCVEYGKGVKFRNYAIKVNSVDESISEIGKYAYLVEFQKSKYLTIEFDSVGVPVDTSANRKVAMTISNGSLALSQSQKEDVRENGVNVLDSVSVKRIKKLAFMVNGVENDITSALTSIAGAKYGDFTFNYPFEGNGLLCSEVEDVKTNDMVVILGKVVDKATGKPIVANALIQTTDPTLGRYTTKILNGDLVILVPKGYEYKITVSQTAYRNIVIEGCADFADRKDIGNVELIYNVLGGVAYNESGSFSIGSGVKGWDMSNESNNEIILTTDFDPPTVYFTGLTVHEYQYAKVSVSNITDVNDYAVYEPDPAIGFQFYTEEKRAFMGLRKTGLRYRSDCSVWAPVQISGYDKNTVNHIDPTGAHKDTLEVIRINRNLYSYINGTYMGHVVLDKEFDGECAIGVQATIAYYGKIRYSDYEIKVGEDAVAIAKERVGLTISYDDTMFDIDEEYNTDYSKPYVKVEGITLEKDGVTLAGTTLTLSRSEFAMDGVGYSVRVGSYGRVILTEQNPVAKFTIPTTAVGELKFACSYVNVCAVVGKIEGSGVSGPFDGVIITEIGSEIKFTTGVDGTFSVGIPASTKFTLEAKVDGYVSRILSLQSNASGEKDIGTVTLYKSLLGGKVKGTQYASSETGIRLGYDADALTVIDGLYADVNVVSGDHFVAINDRTYDDFDVTYKLMRSKYTDRTNETDPGIGIKIRTAMGSESLLFFRTGVRVVPIDGWSKRIEKFNLMPYNIATAYDEVACFRITRRSNTYVMYYKSESAEEWTKVYEHESTMSGTAGLLFHSTNGNNNHYYLWDVQTQ